MGSNRTRRVIALVLSFLIIYSPLLAAKTRERVVLMPVKGEGLSALELSAYRAAIMEGLGKKYDVLTDTEVDSVIRDVAGESMECKTVECQQDVALTLQTELIATSTVLQKGGQYLLRMEVVNVFDNKVIYSRSEPCEACKEGQVLDTLKAMAAGEEIQKVQVVKKKKSNTMMYVLGAVLVGGLAAAAGGGGGGGGGGGSSSPSTGNININW
ncbi:MAG: hypothetical protein ACE5EN_06385 [Nitrospinota bacterium]